ncbi:PQQ-binding-like beta-propeller repeat protein [Pontibacillus sp. HMF3514]|uniref:outer membrane protein assembly factor BamB family protein n=1 Tax=Pontibacillus sp. HMF3514 TaxID=2692425 RepID=UPI00131F8570|nr:PQQ-binding-like beta-propeller repeat protein [Pontibacillus sp. HMF3514]QHE53712.1 PQQ-binding-like beta-propeller repeat protein [Pontibacillus sp. HMF3514]
MKSRIYKLIPLLSIIVLCTISNAIPVSAEDFGPSEWSQYRLNPENNPVYHSDFNSILENTINTNDQIRSTPVIVGNNVYIGNHNTGDIYSYDLINKEMNWQAKAPNWIHSELIYMNNQLFVGYGNRFFHEDGTRGTKKSGLLSLDPSTGEILWKFETKGEVMPTPAFYDNTVYATTGDRHLYAIDPKTGTEKWKLDIGHVASMSSPNIKDGILYVGGGSPRPYTFTAVDLSKQEIVWQTELKDVYAGLDDVPPAIYENLVITTALERKVLSVREVYNRSGLTQAYKQMLKLSFGELMNQKPDHIPKHIMYAMDINSGKMVWKKSLGAGPMVSNNKSGAPMIYEDKVFVGSPITQSFYAYDAKTGDQLWNYKSNINKAPPVADKGVVYFTDKEGLVYAFNVENGELLGKKQLGGKLAPSGPVLMNDHLVVGSQDSNVYVLPTDEIINANESSPEQTNTTTEKSNSVFSFVFFVYVVPIVALLLFLLLIIFVIKKVRK